MVQTCERMGVDGVARDRAGYIAGSRSEAQRSLGEAKESNSLLLAAWLRVRVWGRQGALYVHVT